MKALSTILLEEQLRRVGWSIEKVKEKYGTESNEWLSDIRWSSEEDADEFRSWAIQTIVKKERCGKKVAEHKFSMWDLDIGLGVGLVERSGK